MFKPHPWTCPFCGRDTTITDRNYSTAVERFFGGRHGQQTVEWESITCPNPNCREYALSVTVYDPPVYRTVNGVSKIVGPQEVRHHWDLVPAARMKVLPDYVPPAVVQDYQEACRIASGSPKAAATLARRCLQGMIRDFWGVKEHRLIDEIDALHDRVDPDTWQAIDTVRQLGNIGAHMEQDINTIVDVDTEEARLLIELIETLVDDWYVARHARQLRNAALKAAAEAKGKVLREGPKA